MNRRILASIMVIGLVAAGAGLSTTALFNDTETSADNQFTAGELDLKVDWEESYNGEQVETQELTNDPGAIFDFEDLKPGDHGEATVSLHLDDNPGWIWMNLNQTSNWDNACTEPEHNVEGSCGSEGELDEELEFVVWSDDGDNKLQDDEKVIFEGTAEELEEKSVSEGILLDGNSSTEETEAFPGAETSYIGVKWNLPLETGNRIQGDSLSYDVTFYTEQRRHNEDPDNPWSEIPDEKPDEGNESEEKENESSDSFYQVDLVGGDPIENLSTSTYHSEGRMQRFIHGEPGDAISRESEPDQVKTGTGSVDCVDSEPFTVNKAEDTATVEFEVLNKTPECGTGTELSLVSYEKSYPGWIEDRAGEQEIFDSKNHRFEPGQHSLTVNIPDINDRKEHEEGDSEGCEEPVNESKEFTADEIAQAKYGYDFEGLSGTTQCEVRELFLNQPFSEGLEPEDVMTREEISQEKFSVAFDELSEDSSNEVEEAYEQQFSADSEVTYTASQGTRTVEVEPLEGNMTVQELYDFRLPDQFDNQADNEVLNGATYPEDGPYYGSAGTQDLQRGDTSIMFLYDGPNGLSLVVVHEGPNSEDGGSATWTISNLSEGDWVVKDDLYLNSDGTKAGSNYDDWQTETDPQVINWTWGEDGTDGGAYRPLGEDFSFTIDPAFNEESPIYGEISSYTGQVEDWQVLSGDMEDPERTSLNLTEPVTVETE